MVDVLSPASGTQTEARRDTAWPSPGLAARALYLATATLVASMVAISLFFGGAGALWGPVNDLLVVATVLLLLPSMAVLPRLVGERTGRWFALVSLLAAGGVLVIAAGQLALVVGLIALETSFLTGGLGILPVLVWIGGTVLPARRAAFPGRTVAGWAAAFLALVGLTIVVLATVTTDTPTLTGVLGLPLTIALLGWLVSLARALARVEVV